MFIYVQVPCSRTDLFATKSISLLDKRKMMKFLQFCAEYEQHPQQYEGLYVASTGITHASTDMFQPCYILIPAAC